MADDLMDLLISEAKAHQSKSTEFSEFLWTLRLTGARPGEIRNAEAHNYSKGRLIFRWNTTVGYVHKNAKKTQRDRIIFLTPELQAHVEQLARLNPTGSLFTTPRGKKWSPTSIANNWSRLLKRKAIADYCKEQGIDRKSLKMYNFRHSFLTNWIERAGDIYTVAQLCGTSVKMVEKRYGHPDVDRLHEKYLAFMGGN